MITNKFAFIAPQNGLVHTLRQECVTDIEYPDTSICHQKTHDSGWTISALLNDGDGYYYISEFEATHPVYGSVKGDFDILVIATSELGFNNFIENHPYDEWDYQDN